jgi:hypothetical protein
MLFVFCYVSAARGAGFEGRVLVEWVDDTPFIAGMRVVEPFLFRRESGEAWVVAKGTFIDGRSLSPLFVKLMGHPFEGGFRKSAVAYDAAAKDMKRPWTQAQRMFFEASVTEGAAFAEAKVMYMLLYATGPRWAIRETSTCYVHCHAAQSALQWRPLVDEGSITALVNWVRHEDPPLEQIEQRTAAEFLHPGPHIFGHVR